MMKRYGFTIAEVLIALTIIGVISALTIPTFSENTSKSQYITAFKTTMNQLQSAAQLFKTENNMDFSGTRNETNGPKIIGDMLVAKLNAKENTVTWNVAGKVSSGQVRYGASALTEHNGKNYLKVSSTGCNGTNAYADSEITRLACTGTCTGPCYLKADSLLALNHEPYIQSGMVEKILFPFDNVPIVIGNKDSGKTDYVDLSYTLPSGVVVSVLNIDKDDACHYNGVRWNAKDSQYEAPKYANVSGTGTANTNLCPALIDVNGRKGPNRIVSCGNSDNFLLNPEASDTCEMKKNYIGDVFPVFFHEDKVIPATAAAYTVLYGDIAED